MNFPMFLFTLLFCLLTVSQIRCEDEDPNPGTKGDKAVDTCDKECRMRVTYGANLNLANPVISGVRYEIFECLICKNCINDDKCCLPYEKDDPKKIKCDPQTDNAKSKRAEVEELCKWTQPNEFVQARFIQYTDAKWRDTGLKRHACAPKAE